MYSIAGDYIGIVITSYSIHYTKLYEGDESWYCNISYDGLEDWIGYDVFGDGKILDGRQYILVERDGRWICAFFEWFGKWSENGLHAWGNLNFDHTNLLKGTPLEYPCVITSYSIHYTKLYEGDEGILQRLQLGAIGG